MYVLKSTKTFAGLVGMTMQLIGIVNGIRRDLSIR